MKSMVGYHSGNGEWIYQIPEAPTFYPTAEEFEDPIRYIQKIQAEACRFGQLSVFFAAIPAPAPNRLEMSPVTWGLLLPQASARLFLQ